MKLYLIIAIICGLAGYYVGTAKSEAQFSEDTAKVIEKALSDYRQEIDDANKQNLRLIEKTQLDDEKIKRLRAEVDRSVTSCRSSDLSLRLLNEAINNQSLQPSRYPPEFIGEANPVESYCLYAIGEYNRVAIQLNNLIDEL